MFPHVPPPPPAPARLPTISPLRGRKSVSRVGLHNGWDRLTVQLMIVRKRTPTEHSWRAEESHSSDFKWLTAYTERLEDFFFVFWRWLQKLGGRRCQTEAGADWRSDAAFRQSVVARTETLSLAPLSLCLSLLLTTASWQRLVVNVTGAK